jgi:hypothetical protein
MAQIEHTFSYTCKRCNLILEDTCEQCLKKKADMHEKHCSKPMKYEHHPHPKVHLH